jgi:hypothetical protein
MLLTALTTDLSLELSYSEHICDCLRGLSAEAGLFARELVGRKEDPARSETSCVPRALMNDNGWLP